jgi:molecular chaperone DnaK
MSYQVGVDVGATFTTAAVVRGGRAEVVKIVPTRLPGVPRGFLSRVGDDTPVLVGTRPVPAEVLVAQLVSQVVSAIGAPARLAVTHPVTWGPHRVAALRAALGEVTMLSTAAAVAYGSEPPVAVHDLGGSTFTAAVVRGLATVGQPVELDLGGADLDELVFEHVRAAVDLPADADSLSRLRQACTAAKEALSADTEVEIPVVGQGIDTLVRLTRAEFEEMARPLLAETATAFRMTIEESGVTPATVLLSGGAAWLPLLTQVVSEELGRPVTATPPGAAAIGAALAAGAPHWTAAPREAAFGGQRQAPNPVAASESRVPAARVPAAPVPSAAIPGAESFARNDGRAQAPTRLALNFEPPAPQLDARTTLAEPVRPPVPAATAPPEGKPKRPRTMIAVAAAAVTVIGTAVGITLASGQTPPGAGAETVPTPTTVTSTVPVTTTTTVAPPAETAAPQTPQQKPKPKAPPKTPRTTQPTTTTTTEPTETTTTTQPTTTTSASTKAARAPQTSEGGDR